MQSVNISLPDPLKQFVDGQISTGRYSSASEYVRELIRADEKRKAEERLEARLMEGLSSAETQLTPGFEDQPMTVARGQVGEKGPGSAAEVPTAEAPIPSEWGVVKIFNAIAAVLTMVVLLFAIAIPPVIGRGGTSDVQSWQLIGVAVFFGVLVGVVKKTNFSLLFLFLACAFFFVSCAANFHWQGG